jgi:hypothetical protein
MRNTQALGDRRCELAAHLNAANCRLLELIAAVQHRWTILCNFVRTIIVWCMKAVSM